MGSEFQERRKKLAGVMAKNSILLWPAATIRYRNADTAYPYRQESNFYYLSSFEEPDALLALGSTGVFTLFCAENDPVRARWEGASLGPEKLLASGLADEAYALEDLDTKLLEKLAQYETLYYPHGLDPKFDIKIQKCLDLLRNKNTRTQHYPRTLIDARSLLANLRLIKSPVEIEHLKQAAYISTKGHLALLAKTVPGMYEYELEAILLHEFYRAGARACAYSSIVGGGNNACILHYQKNNEILKEGDLVLVDAGCEWQHYASDITRTFPVSGRFSPAQKSIYELVLSAQIAGINCIKPGVPYTMIQETIVAILSEGLISLGILTASLDEVLTTKAYKKYYMHSSGHWLGLDVHDAGPYEVSGEPILLTAGMVLTVEPGLYFAPEFTEVPEQFRGIGIRIEDDILVSYNGFVNLTEAIPKTIMDIEQHMNRGS
jgi:Xaa-Pro aminopeptidase